jgi:hypothetical protein
VSLLFTAYPPEFKVVPIRGVYAIVGLTDISHIRFIETLLHALNPTIAESQLDFNNFSAS